MKADIPALGRRALFAVGGATAGAILSANLPARAAARYTRHNVTSPEGQRMLASYARGVAAMLKLPADHPQNWFRNAFIHLMDCPHGNWWFYVWHRGYIGYFERTIRSLSGDASFTLPYWDWTETPEIPAAMFDGVLTPTDAGYSPYTGSLARFTEFTKAPLKAYWDSLSTAQRQQLTSRGYASFDALWNDVTGFSPSASAGISGNMAFAITCGARYLSRDNPKLDPRTAANVTPRVVLAGLRPTDYYNPSVSQSFTSSKTTSHDVQPGGATSFSVLEGQPHNLLHNCIGGVGPVDPGPYGNMTNFLSPVDPVFFLHHANMDRLWDVWTRKQQALNLPILPSGQDLGTLAEEPFLFYVGGDGKHVGPKKAGDFFSTEAFGYDYTPGFGEEVIQAPAPAPARQTVQVFKGTVKGNTSVVSIPGAAVRAHLADAGPRTLVAEVTVARPAGLSSGRQFDILVNAPPGVTEAAPGSPYYAGTVAFFGPQMPGMTMPGMTMSHDAIFAVPLPQGVPAFTAMAATGNATLNLRVVPSHATGGPAPTVKGVLVKAS
jgi:tyrosinase